MVVDHLVMLMKRYWSPIVIVHYLLGRYRSRGSRLTKFLPNGLRAPIMSQELASFDRAWVRKTEYEVDDMGQEQEWARLNCSDVVIYECGWVKFTDPDGDEYYLPRTEILGIQEINR